MHNVVPHTTRRNKVEGPYMEDLNAILSRHFLECIGLTNKQNLGGLVRSHVCTTKAPNQIILNEELSRYKLYQSLISDQKCAIEDFGPHVGWIVVPHIAQRVKGEDPYIKGLNLTLLRPLF